VLVVFQKLLQFLLLAFRLLLIVLRFANQTLYQLYVSFGGVLLLYRVDNVILFNPVEKAQFFIKERGRVRFCSGYSERAPFVPRLIQIFR
jgi:hypothetical protein